MSDAATPPTGEIQQFVFREARLLDEQRWQAWSDLFTEDGTYWVPASVDQPDPINHVSLIYEDSLLRAIRLRRYDHPNALSLQPLPRSLHLVSNIMVDDYDAGSGRCRVNSRQIMVEYRRDQQQVLAGAVTHELVRVEGDFRMQSKRVDLVNCDAMLESIQIYL